MGSISGTGGVWEVLLRLMRHWRYQKKKGGISGTGGIREV